MKKNSKLQILAAAIILTAATLLQSCLGDNNDDKTANPYLTKQDAQLVLLSMMGEYNGQLFYTNRETQKRDSCQISLYTNGDSILHIVNIPSEIITSFLHPITPLKEAVSQKLDKTVALDLSILSSYIITGTDKAADGNIYGFPLRAYLKINDVEYRADKHDFFIQYYTDEINIGPAVYGTVKKTGQKVIEFDLFTAGIYDQKDKTTPIINGFQLRYDDTNNAYCNYHIAVTK